MSDAGQVLRGTGAPLAGWVHASTSGKETVNTSPFLPGGGNSIRVGEDGSKGANDNGDTK
ncbi:hypothetical protein E2C01_069147 [Portunus trituberculatus]|uniref:Uncharacterized protein n=1 Tax=Portunus trituberculatus TaxID=210409 RepID=A0A5B7HTU7_PORTR|nr:hypothetical protein [Portunus trituberculatus]